MYTHTHAHTQCLHAYAHIASGYTQLANSNPNLYRDFKSSQSYKILIISKEISLILSILYFS